MVLIGLRRRKMGKIEAERLGRVSGLGEDNILEIFFMNFRGNSSKLLDQTKCFIAFFSLILKEGPGNSNLF